MYTQNLGFLTTDLHIFGLVYKVLYRTPYMVLFLKYGSCMFKKVQISLKIAHYGTVSLRNLVLKMVKMVKK
jgi:hypothetical protein